MIEAFFTRVILHGHTYINPSPLSFHGNMTVFGLIALPTPKTNGSASAMLLETP